MNWDDRGERPLLGQETFDIIEKFPEFSRQEISNFLLFQEDLGSSDGTLISLRSLALALTLSGLAGGEYLPLPRSEGGVFPFLLALDGAPPLPQTSLRDISVHKTEETPHLILLT